MRATKGTRVAIHYQGTLDDGEVFDSSEGREPFEFTMGAQEMIPGFERAVRGMSPGEEKTIVLNPVEGYGDRDEALVIRGPRSAFPPGQVFEGEVFTVHMKSGGEADARVVSVEDEAVTLDFNHPLAGKRLTFHVRVVSVT